MSSAKPRGFAQANSLDCFRAAVRLRAAACQDPTLARRHGSYVEIETRYAMSAWRNALAATGTPIMLPTPIPASATTPRKRHVSRSGRVLDITLPFRSVDLSTFPPGTWAVPLEDATHCAVLALTHALQAVHTDAARFLAVTDPSQATTVVHTHARFHYELAQVALSGLPPDQLSEWQPRVILDAPSSAHLGPALLARHALTESALAACALQWAAVAYVRLLARGVEAGEAPVTALARHIDDLDCLRHALRDELTRRNAELLAAQGVPYRSHVVEAVFRSDQHPHPVAAIVPLVPPSGAGKNRR